MISIFKYEPIKTVELETKLYKKRPMVEENYSHTIFGKIILLENLFGKRKLKNVGNVKGQTSIYAKMKILECETWLAGGDLPENEKNES